MDQERYQITKMLEKSLVGDVYRAEDKSLNRNVIIRRFASDHNNSNSTDWKDRFLNLAPDLCAIEHPNIATVFDTGIDEDGAYIISQQLEGQPLGERIIQGKINEWDVYVTVEAILDALSVAHAAGFIHGAFGPASIIRVPRPSGSYRNVIIDLGLNQLAQLIRDPNSSALVTAEPCMMAPEQFENMQPTAASDLYMIGQFAFTCLIGGHPFAGQSLEDTKKSYEQKQLKHLSKYNSKVSPEFAEWIHQLILKDPAERPQSTQEALASLPKLKKPTDYKKTRQISLTTGSTAATVNTQLANSTARLQTATPNNGGAHSTAKIAASTTTIAHPQLQSLTSTPQQNSNQLPKKSNQLAIFISLSAVVILSLTGLIIYFATKGDDEPENKITGKKETPTDTESPNTADNNTKPIKKSPAVAPTLNKTPTLNKAPNFTVSVQLVTHKGGYLKTDQLAKKSNFNKGRVDYIIADGTQLSDYKVKRKGPSGYFNTLELNGQTQQSPATEYTLKLREDGTQKWLFPEYQVSNENQEMTKQTGFKITGQTPPDHKGALKFRFFISSAGIQPSISFRYLNGNKKAKSAIIPTKEDGIYTLLYKVSASAPNQKFEILVTYGKDVPGSTSPVKSLSFNGALVQ